MFFKLLSKKTQFLWIYGFMYVSDIFIRKLQRLHYFFSLIL